MSFGIAICRIVEGQRLIEGAVFGYRCKLCNTALQITRHVADKVQTGELHPLCNDCGFKVADKAKLVGIELLPLLTPTAMKQCESDQADPEHSAWVNQLEDAFCAHCGEPVPKGKAASHACARNA